MVTRGEGRCVVEDGAGDAPALGVITDDARSTGVDQHLARAAQRTDEGLDGAAVITVSGVDDRVCPLGLPRG
jgi:hypothetical protein